MRRRPHIVSCLGAIVDRVGGRAETGTLEAEVAWTLQEMRQEGSDTTEGWRRWRPISFNPPGGAMTCPPQDTLQV
jgi:hypothetical protein